MPAGTQRDGPLAGSVVSVIQSRSVSVRALKSGPGAGIPGRC